MFSGRKSVRLLIKDNPDYTGGKPALPQGETRTTPEGNLTWLHEAVPEL